MKRKVLVNVVGVLLAFLLGALVMLLQGYNPLETYYRLFEYSLAPGKITYTLSKSVPLILTGMSASVAFASGRITKAEIGKLVRVSVLRFPDSPVHSLPPVLMVPF